MASFDSSPGGDDDLGSLTRPFDNDGYMGFDPRLPSQRFDSFRVPEESYGDAHSTQEDFKDEDDEFGTHKERRTSSSGGFDAMGGGGSSPPPPYHSSFDDDDLGEAHFPSMSSSNFGQSFDSRQQADFASSDEFSQPMNDKGLGHDDSFAHNEGFGYGFPPPADFHDGGAVLPPPDEMETEEGFILREWKRKNAIRLEEKAKNERERLSQIIDAADAYKEAFYEKRKAHCEASKKNNRDKEKVFLENHKDFHANADKHYWKAVAEIIPHELPTKEVKSRGKKDQKKPSVVINHGPKPGKTTDLTRMRQVLVKLKHNPPPHMKPPPPPPPAPPAEASKDGGDGKASAKSGSGDGKATASTPATAPAPAPAPAPASAPAPLQKQGSIPTAAVA